MKRRRMLLALSWVCLVIQPMGCSTIGSSQMQKSPDVIALASVISANAAVEVDGNNSSVASIRLNIGRVSHKAFDLAGRPNFSYDLGYARAEKKELTRFLKALAECDELTALEIAGLKIEDPSFLRDLDNIQSLNLAFCGLRLDALSFLGHCEQLEELDVSGNEVDPNIVTALAGLPNLKVLHLDGLDLNRESLESLLSGSPSLQTVYVRGNSYICEADCNELRSKFGVNIIRNWESIYGYM